MSPLLSPFTRIKRDNSFLLWLSAFRVLLAMVRTKSNVQVSSAPVATLFSDLMMLSKNNTAFSLQRELVCSDDVLKLLAGQEEGKEATDPDFEIINGDKNLRAEPRYPPPLMTRDHRLTLNSKLGWSAVSSNQILETC
ncbi:hypothetical protein BGZ91_005713 [Linnemannia elongata]|nr:hypothetical protein BGZ91_005713 [Linnemannia elongata]KAG0078713.1 hypothetical protein BGZ90_004560 [Linnemannia elongata]